MEKYTFDKKIPGPLEALVQSLYCVADELVKQGQSSIEVFVQKMSDGLDEYVIKEESAGDVVLVSGEVFLRLLEDASDCYIETDLYFKNREGKWLKKTARTKPIPVEWALVPEEQEKLKQAKTIKFPYEHP